MRPRDHIGNEGVIALGVVQWRKAGCAFEREIAGDAGVFVIG